jgi:cytochrome P450 family 710 subfamily A protein
MIKSKHVDLIRALVIIFRPDRAEDSKYRQNFLTFGVGPHMCVGREYAINHLIAFLSILSTSVDWERRITPESNKIKFLPTIYPADCLVTLAPRKASA